MGDTCQTLGASNITSTAAQLNGSLLDTSSTGGVFFWEWGPLSTFNEFATGQNAYSVGFGPFPVGTSISGLTPSTLYGFEMVVQAAGFTGIGAPQGFGGVLSFTTAAAFVPPPPPPPPQFPPTVTIVAATAVTSSSAVLQASVFPNSFDTTFHFNWGTTPSVLGATSTLDAGAGSVAVLVNASLSGLAPTTTYYYNCVATNGYGSAVSATNTLVTNPNSDMLSFFGR
jgi:hypothetical protein